MNGRSLSALVLLYCPLLVDAEAVGKREVSDWLRDQVPVDPVPGIDELFTGKQLANSEVRHHGAVEEVLSGVERIVLLCEVQKASLEYRGEILAGPAIELNARLVIFP